MALAVSPPPDGGYSDVGGAAPEVAQRYRYDFNLDGYPDYVIVQPTTDQPFAVTGLSAVTN